MTTCSSWNAREINAVKIKKQNLCTVSLAVYYTCSVPSLEETVSTFSLSHSDSYQSWISAYQKLEMTAALSLSLSLSLALSLSLCLSVCVCVCVCLCVCVKCVCVGGPQDSLDCCITSWVSKLVLTEWDGITFSLDVQNGQTTKKRR